MVAATGFREPAYMRNQQNFGFVQPGNPRSQFLTRFASNERTTEANTTILQFNAGGSTSYTATNDIADPFSIKGILLNSSSSAAITLDGNNTTGLQFSTATPFLRKRQV